MLSIGRTRGRDSTEGMAAKYGWRSVYTAMEPNMVSYPFWLGAAAALLALTVGLLILGRVLAVPLTDVQWKPAESWVTNLAFIGSALNLLLVDQVLPSGDEYPAAKYVYVLAALFAALAALAPGAYSAAAGIRRATGPQEPPTSGAVGLFIPVASLTLWAGVGQLWLLDVVLRQIERTRLIEPHVRSAVTALICVVTVAVLVYAIAILVGLRRDAGALAEAAAADGTKLRALAPLRRVALL